MPDDGLDDFIEAIDTQRRAREAIERANAAPQRPRIATKRASVGGYGRQALSNEIEAIKSAQEGTRNDTVNTAAFNLGQIIGAGQLNRNEVENEIASAARQVGLTEREIRKLLRDDGGIAAGAAKPRDMAKVQERQRNSSRSTRRRTKPKTNGHSDEALERIVSLKSLSTVKSIVPQWVWEYEGEGRIQLGTLTMFAGRPGAGKSTAARWFAARISRGELPGVWQDNPHRVAVLMTEEQTDALVVPGLQACNANLANIFEPEVTMDGDEACLMSVRDEHRLTEELVDNNIRALFIDPVMSTFDGHVDIYRNNDVRQYLAPFTRIAKAINGIVVCVTHLRKGDVKDVLDSVNGSSAFGEVPRAVFGFAPISNGEHLIEQVKNSAGPRDLKMLYKLPIENVDTDDGSSIMLPRFQMTEPTQLSISDLSGLDEDQDAVTADADLVWLLEYLRREQPAFSAELKRVAKQDADISDRRLHRARKKLGVRIINDGTPDKPHRTSWTLPDYPR